MKSFLTKENSQLARETNHKGTHLHNQRFNSESDTATVTRAPSAIALNRFTLKFNGSCAALEPLFLSAYFKEAFFHTRLAILAGIVIWSVFSFLDVLLAGNEAGPLLMLRLGIMVPFTTLIYLLSFSRHYHKYFQFSLSAIIAVAGITVTVMIIVAPPPAHYLYYAGINLVLFYGFTLLKIRFIWAASTAVLVIAFYEALTLNLKTIPGIFLLNNNFFLLGSAVMGMLAAYFIEFHTRKSFFLNHLLEIEQKKLATANRNLGNRVKKRTRALQITNLSLAESQKRLTTIFNSVQSGIAIIDAEHSTITDVNSTAAYMIGARKGEIIGRHCHDFFAADKKGYHNIKADAHDTNQIEDMLITNTGKQFPILKTAVPIILDHQRHFLISFLDIKELKDTEDEKRRLEEQLIQAQKIQALGTLAGGIAHDFNNILFGMIGYTELAMDEVAQNTELQDHLQEIIKGANRAAELVNQILTFSRQAEQERKPIRIVSLVKEALKLLRATMPTTIVFKESVDPKTHTIYADPTQVHQVIMNICTNAFHAMNKSSGTLGVELSNVLLNREFIAPHEDLAEGPYVCLKIEDSGHGMAPEVMARIFDPFFTTKGQGEGTGMGLSVVHGIVKSHGGAIRVKSNPGEGTSISIFWPALDADVTDPLLTKPDTPGGNEHILIVDDESGLVRMETQLLGTLGYTVTGRTSSHDALKVFRQKPREFDLVITDLTMPEMTGIELSKAILKIRPDIPIILCTGYSTQRDEIEKNALGIRTFLSKPIEKQMLATKVREALVLPPTNIQ